MNTVQQKLQHSLDLIWRADVQGWPRHLQQAARLLICTARELQHGDLTLRAMSLVYTTLLALVPLLALSFSIFKALDLHNQIEPMLLGLLQPLGSEAPRVVQTLLGFIDNIKIGVLGSIGVALLFYTVLAMIQKVEAAFNHVWKIPRTRPMGQRISQYLVVLLLGPLAITLTFGITATLSSSTVVETLLDLPGIGGSALLLGRLTPLLVICAVFAFLFMLIPNTRVNTSAAVLGGVVSGILWQGAALAFAKFVANAGNYNAVYSSFAILIMLLIWLYIAWLVLLIGCQISFFYQHPEYLRRRRIARALDPVQCEALMLDAMVEIGLRFVRAQPPLTTETLAQRLRARPEHLLPLVENLVQHAILAEDGQGALLLARAPETLPLTEMNDWLVNSEDQIIAGRPLHTTVVALRDDLNAARAQALGQRTLADLLR